MYPSVTSDKAILQASRTLLQEQDRSQHPLGRRGLRGLGGVDL